MAETKAREMEAKNPNNNSLPSQEKTKGSGCENRKTRITKENLYMVLALWMEKFPHSQSSLDGEAFHKVGVVFVLPNDRVLAADCSRDNVHGVARVMTNHCGMLEGCKVFISRKPCSLCAKLLVQSRVSRVFYLPIKPESEDEKDLKRVDNLFKVSPVGQSVFVPCVEEKVLTNEEQKLAEKITDKIDHLFDQWWSAESVTLHWPKMDDKMKTQVEQDFKSLMKWIAVVKEPIDKGIVFQKVKNIDDANDDEKYSDQKLASHMMIFAKMLARQTDDPKKGVGAVLLKGKEFVSLGWNGFPSKALYGEFPRASDDDKARETKFPYVIHAEQNALLVRNTKDLTDGVLFVTKSPCDECAPMVKLSGVKTIVVGETIDSSHGGKLSYNEIKNYIKDNHFACFEMRDSKKAPAKRSAPDPEVRKDLSQEKYMKSNSETETTD